MKLLRNSFSRLAAGCLIVYLMIHCAPTKQAGVSIPRQKSEAAGGTAPRPTQDCLSTGDLKQVRSFLKQVGRLLEKRDTAGIMNMIEFPLEVEPEMTVDPEQFLAGYYQTVSHYLLRRTIDRSEVYDLQRSEGFEEIEGKSGCFRYGIYNAFPKLEFDVYLYLEKINGRLKITSLRIIG